MQTQTIEHFNSFRTFIVKNAQDSSAILDVEAVRTIYRKGLYGPYDLTPADKIDADALAKAITLATGMDADDLVIISASGMFPDQGRLDNDGDLVQIMYQAAVGKDNAGRLSWHVSANHGAPSLRFLQPQVCRRLGLSVRDGGLGFRLPRSIRAGYGGALINRLNRAVDVDIGVNNAMAETLISTFSYTVLACLLPYLGYTLAGLDEGKFTLMPLVEQLEHALPLCEIPGSPGTWLVLGG